MLLGCFAAGASPPLGTMTSEKSNAINKWVTLYTPASVQLIGFFLRRCAAGVDPLRQIAQVDALRRLLAAPSTGTRCCQMVESLQPQPPLNCGVNSERQWTIGLLFAAGLRW